MLGGHNKCPPSSCFHFVGLNVILSTQINNKVLRYDKNHQSVIHRKCPEARISLMQKVESKECGI